MGKGTRTATHRRTQTGRKTNRKSARSRKGRKRRISDTLRVFVGKLEQTQGGGRRADGSAVGGDSREQKLVHRNRVRFRTIGNIAALPQNCVEEIRALQNETKNFDRQTLVLALNYGSRDELVRAFGKMARDVADGRLSPEKIGWQTIAENLDTADIPDPDLLIRTSGEMRLSNYLMLQAAYAELYFTKTYWPDFGRDDFAEALRQYRLRERRYGLTGEQLK